MPEMVTPGPVGDAAIREAVCVHTRKIYDSCRDKDCVEDLRLYTSPAARELIGSAVSVRGRSAELLYVTTDVEEISFNRGYYSINLRYFYKVNCEALAPVSRPTNFSGLAVFDKTVILFGSEGSAKVFSSDTNLGELDMNSVAYSNLPTCVVEAVDPIVLGVKLVDCVPTYSADGDTPPVPSFIAGSFDSELDFSSPGRGIYVTLGQFSIVRLERDSQLLIPSYDYCMPDKECHGSDDDDPCALFSRIAFPVDEFFPPDTISCPEGYREA
ncbi:MAG: hypothetical protein IKI49_03955, partial [Oscillospiraceae bacterium]|nr:hypothetical protein [Oscillospiraceae bacterium]